MKMIMSVVRIAEVCPPINKNPPHGIQTLAHDFSETYADETMKLVNLQRPGGDGAAEGEHKRQRDNRI